MSGRSTRLTARLRQTAVYWGNPVPTGDGGYTFDDPVELKPVDRNGVRWEERQELFRDKTGKQVLSHAVVFVAQDVDLDGYLYLGDLDDLDSGEEADPQTVATARKIRGFRKVPGRDATDFERTVYL